MKKAIIVLIILMAFTGCQQNKTASDINNDQSKEITSIDEITTFKEVIKGVQVEIDGIVYDINNAEKTTYIYDDNTNVIKENLIHSQIEGDKIVFDEYISEYKIFEYNDDNQLLKEEKYTSDDVSNGVTYYDYADGKLVNVKLVTSGNNEINWDYSYDGNEKNITYTGPNGEIISTATVYMDEKGNEVKSIEKYIKNGESTSRTYHYNQSGQLVKADIKESNGREYTFNSEYNNVDDLIIKYIIVHGEETSRLLVDLFKYDYTEDFLKKSFIHYHMNSEISNENIREY